MNATKQNVGIHPQGPICTIQKGHIKKEPLHFSKGRNQKSSKSVNSYYQQTTRK